MPVMLQLVGNCPKCGSPIYGPKRIEEGQVANVQRTCICTILKFTFDPPLDSLSASGSAESVQVPSVQVPYEGSYHVSSQVGPTIRPYAPNHEYLKDYE